MNNFTIKDIENLSGIKAHTLRIWEKRYSIITPKRKESNHRFYDNEDLKQVLRITNLYNNGYKISAIANMNEDELLGYETTAVSAEGMLVNKLLEAALDLNEFLFNQTLDEAINISGLEACMIKVVYPYLEKIGILWMKNEALPAQERFASNIIIKKMVNEIDKIESSFTNHQPSVILFTPPKEYHEIPLLFMYYLLKKNHQHVYYLGANVTLDVLDAFSKTNRSAFLYFHVITNLTHDNIDNYLLRLTNHFADQKIVMSGMLAKTVSIKAENLQLLHSLEDMMSFGKGNFEPA
ncbi:MAG: MerR family transcriptional regulator [Parafilimonas sp.]